MNLVLAESRRLTADSQRLEGSLAARLSTTKNATDFWTFGPGRASPEIQKSLPFIQPFSSTNAEKESLKRASTGVRRNDFWIAFMGPPWRARKSKSRSGKVNERFHAQRPPSERRDRGNRCSVLRNRWCGFHRPDKGDANPFCRSNERQKLRRTTTCLTYRQYDAFAGDAIPKCRQALFLSPKTRFATTTTAITPSIGIAPPCDAILSR